jgi:hypothetical protein
VNEPRRPVHPSTQFTSYSARSARSRSWVRRSPRSTALANRRRFRADFTLLGCISHGDGVGERAEARPDSVWLETDWPVETGRYRTNVWNYAGVNTLRANRIQELAMHPTVKPVALVADAIKDCSKRGDVVLDPFAGSGTTLIAAEKTGGAPARSSSTQPTATRSSAGLSRPPASKPSSPAPMRASRRWLKSARASARPSRRLRREPPQTQTQDPNYRVGYARPPVHTRFQRGVSGNPGGRPRGRTASRVDNLILKEVCGPASILTCRTVSYAVPRGTTASLIMLIDSQYSVISSSTSSGDFSGSPLLYVQSEKPG